MISRHCVNKVLFLGHVPVSEEETSFRQSDRLNTEVRIRHSTYFLLSLGYCDSLASFSLKFKLISV